MAKKTSAAREGTTENAASKIKIFLSYAREKSTEATRIFNGLQAAKFTVWMDQVDVSPGDEWEQHIKAEILECNVFIPCLSTSSNDPTRYQYKELEIAREAFRKKSIKIIPIRLEPCPPVDIVNAFSWVEMVELVDPDIWKRLIDSIGKTSTPKPDPRLTVASSGSAPILPWLDRASLTFPHNPSDDVLDSYLGIEHRFKKRDHSIVARLPLLPEQLAPVGKWIQCVLWYEDVSAIAGDWMSLGAGMDSFPGDIPTSPKSLADACEPVAERFDQAWTRAFMDAVAQFRKELPTKQEALLRFQQRLEPLFAAPWSQLIVLAQFLHSHRPPLCDLVAGYLEKLSAGSVRTSQSINELQNQPLPPDRESIELCRENAAIGAACKQLSDLLSAAPKVEGPSDEIKLLVRDLNARHAALDPQEKIEKMLILREHWVFALQSLLSEDGDHETALAALTNAGAVFPKAAEHAKLIGEWCNAKLAYDDFRTDCQEVWPTSIAILETCEDKLKAVGDRIVKALVVAKPAWLDKETLHKIEKRTEDQLNELTETGKTWAWLNSLREGALPAKEARLGLLQEWDELQQALSKLATISKTPYLWKDSPDQWPEQVLLTPIKSLKGWAGDVDCALGELNIARGKSTVLQCFTCPHLDALRLRFGLLLKLTEIWQNVLATLAERDFARSRILLTELESQFRGMQWLEDMVQLAGEADALSGSIRQGTVFSWQDSRQQANQLEKKVRALQLRLPLWARKTFQKLLLAEAGSLRELETELEAVADTEERIREALRSLQSGDFPDAANRLENIQQSLAPGLPQFLKPDATLWLQAARALVELSDSTQDLSKLLSLVPDPKSGLLPPEGPLEQSLHFSKIRDKATETAELAQRANAQSKLRCSVPNSAGIPGSSESALEHAKLLTKYREWTHKLEEKGRLGKWAEAKEEAKQFEPGDLLLDGYMRLLEVINTALEAETYRALKNPLKALRRLDLEHPFLVALRREREGMVRDWKEQWSRLTEAADVLCKPLKPLANLADLLKTPVVPEPDSLPKLGEALDRLKEAGGREELLQAAGRNRCALLALAGEITSVAGDLRTSSDYIPHNLVVAAEAYLRKERKIPPHIDAALSACALLRDSDSYQESLRAALGVALPDTGAMEVLLRDLFTDAGLKWGNMNDQQSPLFRFHIELGATWKMRASSTASSLPRPMGPALVEFYGLHERLSLSLISAPPGLRRWYGPLAGAEALLGSGQSREAQAVLTAIEPQIHTAASYPVYAAAANPVESMKEDWMDLKAACLLYELRQIRVSVGFNIDNLASTVSGLCAGIFQNSAKVGDVAREIDRVFSELLATEGTERMEKAYRVMTQLLTERNTPLHIYHKHLRKKRSDLALKLLLCKPDAVPNIRAIIPELVNLAEEAFHDAPTDPTACIMRHAIRVLQAKETAPKDLEAQKPAVQLLLARALHERWPFTSITMIKELLNVLDGTGEQDRWLRNLAVQSFNKGGPQ